MKCADGFTAMKDGQTCFVKTVIDSFAKELSVVIFIPNLEINESVISGIEMYTEWLTFLSILLFRD